MSKKMFKLAGGEALSKPQELDSISLADNLIDMRYYPFKGTLPTNISTEEAEYIPYEAKNLNTGMLEWEVEPAMKGYIDLNNSFVRTVKKIQYQGDDLNLTNTAQRCVFESWQSLLEFKDAKLFLNGKDASDQHDGGVYPYSALHKALLTEKNLDNIAGNVQFKTYHDSTLSTQVSPASSKAIYEDLYDWAGNQIDLDITSANTINNYKLWKAVQYNEIVAGSTTITRLRDGIWQQDKFLPPATQMRLQLVKNDVAKVIRTPANGNVVNFSIAYSQATLYLRRCYPRDETIDSITSLAQTIPRQYPLVRGRTTYFNIPSGSFGVDRSSLLTGSKPSVVVVQFVSANAFNGSVVVHPFSCETGASTTTMKPDVASMFLRVGSRRYPQNFDYGHSNGNMLDETPSYMEYLRCCEPDAGDILPARPMLNPLNKNLNIYVFNTRQNNENMFDRADDDTGLDGIEIHAKFNVATTVDTVCVITAFSNDVLAIDPNGKVLTD